MASKVIDFNQKKKEAMAKRKREFERVLFENVLGVYSVVDREGRTQEVSIVDVSPKGCLIDFPQRDFKAPKKDSAVSLRLYFTSKSYLPLDVVVRHCRRAENSKGLPVFRCGCEFEINLTRFEAMSAFINFIYKLAEHAVTERTQSQYSPR
jgi:hypothetical protein